MLRLLLFIPLFLLLVSCSSTRKTTATPASNGSSVSTTSQAQTTSETKIAESERDGTSFEKAIIIDKKNSSEGIAAEYAWLREHYPGHTVLKQSLHSLNGKRYDVLLIRTKEGGEKSFHFDITKFFGKY